jgi:endonuclease/exonuclease/phosphatase family metal-dependent hydrolase
LTAHPSIAFERDAQPDIERGSFVPPDVPTPSPSSIVVTTFNIRYAVGSFLITGSLFRRIGIRRPARRPQLVARNISKAARALSDGERMPPADIVALQEADRETVRAGGRHVARELARELRMHYARAAMRVPAGEEQKSKQWYLDFEELIGADEAGDTGVAFLSRVPLIDAERLELPWSECAWRPRLALGAKFMVGERTLHLFNAHIDPHTGTEGQLAQHEAILTRAGELSAGEPSVLLGDYNTLRSESRTATRRLLESHGYTSPLPNGTGTWRAGLLRLHADWIFMRGARVKRWGVARGLSVSDHWPVWVEIELDERNDKVES